MKYFNLNNYRIPYLAATVLLSVFIIGCYDKGAGAGGSADIATEMVKENLATFDLNSPGVAADIVRTLAKGDKYRKRIQDQNDRGATLTAWIERKEEDIFCITFYRDETCPDCDGTGRKKAPDFLSTRIAGIDFTCQRCKGTGVLKNQYHKKCWVLSGSDFSSKKEAKKKEQEYTFRSAPEGTKRYVKLLSSDKPQDRLDACLWLDSNYIRPGLFFREIIPILDRARYTGTVKDESLATKILGTKTGAKKVTVYQFWAGKGIPSEWKRAFYRIYIDSTTGRVMKKTFAPETNTGKQGGR